MRFRTTRLRASPLGVLVVLVAGFFAWGATHAPPTSDGAFDIPTMVEAAAVVAPTTAAAESSTTTTLPETTTTTAPRPPVIFNPIPPGGRVNLGGDKHPIIPIPAIGMIEIPKIGLVHPVFEGIEESEIHWGPGHWPGSAMPGMRGNTIFAGHRVTHTRPFLDIDLLSPGDKIIFHTADGTFTYEVSDHIIVTPDATWIANPTPDPTVTIFGCHPKHSANQRYVVWGKLMTSSPDPYAAG